jgi:hypothetical protein
VVDPLCALSLGLHVLLEVVVWYHRCLSALSIGAKNPALAFAMTVSHFGGCANLSLRHEHLGLLNLVDKA